jgi:hypothetical protein
MQKSLIRSLKNHYGYRWEILRHNQKHTEKINSAHDAVIMQYLVPGSTLAFEFVARQYQGIIPNLAIDQPGVYDNVLMLNTQTTKYRSLPELGEIVAKAAQQCRYRLIVGFNFQFVKFNRLRDDFYTELQIWINQLATHNIMLVKNLTECVPKTNPYGDCLFVFERTQ